MLISNYSVRYLFYRLVGGLSVWLSVDLVSVCADTVTYKNQYVIKINDADLASVQEDLRTLDMRLDQKILSSIYVFDLKTANDTSDKPDISFLHKLKACCQGKIKDAEQVVEKIVSLWASPDDYRKLEENAKEISKFPDNYSAWSSEHTGRGVVIGVIGVGLDINLPVVIPSKSIDLEHSLHLLQGTNTSTLKQQSPNSSTNTTEFQNCVVVVAAAEKEHCDIDIKYRSKVAGLKVLEIERTYRYKGGAASSTDMTSVDENYEIFCTNWNPTRGFDAHQVTVSSANALIHGIKHGRGSKGSIFVFPVAGIGDEYTNSMYTITVNGANERGNTLTSTRISACVLVSTFEEEAVIHNKSDPMKNEQLNSTCSRGFPGSSGTAAVVAGVIGLALQINELLRWRDIQHLLVESTVYSHRFDSRFRRNGAGKHYNYMLGFGFVNATKLITLAKTWIRVPDQRCHDVAMNTSMVAYSCNTVHTSPSTCTASFAIPSNTGIAAVEHVITSVSYTTPDEYNTDIMLESPSHTNSVLMNLGQSNIKNATKRHNIRFLSVHFWGEKVTGSWILTFRCYNDGSPSSSVQLALSAVTVTICGTASAKPDVLNYALQPKKLSMQENENIERSIVFTCIAVVIGICVIIVVGRVTRSRWVKIKRGIRSLLNIMNTAPLTLAKPKPGDRAELLLSSQNLTI